MHLNDPKLRDERGRPQPGSPRFRGPQDASLLMIWFLRSLSLIAIGVVIGVGGYHLLVSKDLNEASATVAKMEGADSGKGSTLEASQGSDPLTTLPEDISGDLMGSGVPADDVEASDLKHPLTRSLGEVIERNRSLFDQIGAEGLGDSLAEADAVLWDVKQQNRTALRQVNRQMRIASTTPNVVLVAVDGLQWQPKEGLEQLAATMPALYRIARQGRYASLSPNVSPEEQRSRLASGSKVASSGNAANFSEALWNSGYTTAVIGEAWWWATGPSNANWDNWLGFHREPLAKAYPEQIWNNGRTIRLPANGEGKKVVAAHDLYSQEVLSYLDQHRRGRPFALVLSLGNSAYHSTIDPLLGESQIAWTDADELLNEIDIRLNQLELARNTLFIIVGVSPVNGLPSPSGYAPLLVVRDLRRVPQNAAISGTIAYEDILPTVLYATASQRVPPGIDGQSQWKVWSARPLKGSSL